MRPWQIIILIIVLAFLAVSSGWRVLYLLTYVLLTLFILSWFWTRYSLRKMVFRRTASVGRVQVGETFDERLMLDNISVMPKLWVQIADGSTLPGHRAGYVASMGGRKRATWRARTVCKQRGRFLLGPVTATSGDPFGLFHRRITLTQPKDLLVLPCVLPISDFVLFTGGLPGRGRGSKRALHSTTNASNIRDYTVGDALNRIHWRSTAHYNTLMVKEFDLDPAMDGWIFLDLNEFVQAGEGEDSTVEYGVTIAATIATYLLRQDLSLGMIVNGAHREFLSLDRGERQIERVLEMFAVVITPSTSRDWHDSLRHLQRRGVQVAVVGLDAASFEDRPIDEDTLALLEGAGIPVLRVKCKASLTEALERVPEARYARWS